jgi:hypothetical protein
VTHLIGAPADPPQRDALRVVGDALALGLREGERRARARKLFGVLAVDDDCAALRQKPLGERLRARTRVAGRVEVR